MRLVLICISVLIAVGSAAGQPGAQDPAVKIRLGWFEGGEHPIHDLFREEYIRQLNNIAGPDTQFVFGPEGYASGSWVRDTVRIMSRDLARLTSIDVMVAIGPWVVEELLEAGYEQPILGVRQLDALGGGLITEKGRPVRDNLTIHDIPGKIEDDIDILTRLTPVKRLGVLLFTSSDGERDMVRRRIEHVTAQRGIEVVYGEGVNKFGTYAFFNAFHDLEGSVDAVYTGPMWGMTAQKISAFFDLLASRGVPSMCWEGRYVVARGAFATNYAYGMVSEAHYQAWKTLRIARGETPADLPSLYRGGSSLAINLATADLARVTVPPEALISGETMAEAAPDAVEQYSLTDAVNRALAGNPGFLATYNAIEKAAQAARQVGSSYLPHVYLEGEAGWVDDNTLNNTVEPLANEQYRASFVLDQKIFSLEDIRARKTAGLAVRLARARREQARRDLELAVATAYLNYLRSEQKLLLERRYREFSERTVELTAARYNIHGTGEADLLRWQDERQQAISRVIEAENAVVTGRAMINILLNLPPENPIMLDTTVVTDRSMGIDYQLLSPLSVKPKQRQELEEQLIAALRSNNPALAVHDTLVALEQSRLSQVTGRFWPTLDLETRFNLADEIDDDLGVIDERTDSWSISGQLRFPLFLGGERFRDRNRLRASVSEQEFRRDATLLRGIGDVKQVTGKMLSRLVAWPRSGRSTELAVRNMQLQVDEYESGAASVTSLIEAYNHARETELNALAVRYGYLESVAQLVHAVGWSSSAGGQTFHGVFRENVTVFLEEE